MTPRPSKFIATPVSRRGTLLGIGAAAAAASLGTPTLAFAGSPIPQRLVIMNCNGGLDGLAMMIPYGDTSLPGLRAALLPPAVGHSGGMLDLDGFFALSPAMPNLYSMFQAGEALLIHQVAPPVYIRSHFAGQNYLQYGATSLLSTGWAGRMLNYLPSALGTVQSGIALGPVTPTVMLGAVTDGWGGNNFTHTTPGLGSTCILDTQSDAVLGPALSVGIQDRSTYSGLIAANPPPTGSSLVTLAGQAGTFLASPIGPGVASLTTVNVDTHSSQNANLPGFLTDIDNALKTLKTTLGSAWANTVVMSMTEFGRKAAINGSAGTDHGTGFAMFLAGGALAGGRVLNTQGGGSGPQAWTPLATLFDGQDNWPVTSFFEVAGGVLRDHMGMNNTQLSTIFPSYSGPFLGGMIKAGR